jgi:hypothetical protein
MQGCVMSVQISVRPDDEVRAELEEQARAKGIGLATLLRDLATRAARDAKRARIREEGANVGARVAASPEAAAFSKQGIRTTTSRITPDELTMIRRQIFVTPASLTISTFRHPAHSVSGPRGRRGPSVRQPSVMALFGSSARAHDPAAFQAFRAPHFLKIIEFGECDRVCRQRNPRQLRGREDMDIRREATRVIHRSDPDEADRRPRLRIVAPDGDLANGTARDPLPPAAGRRRVDHLGLAT